MTDFDPRRWRRMQPILDRVLELPRRDRGAWLDKACAGDERLRADVEAVLAADAEAGGLLDAPTGGFIDWFVEEAREQTTLTTPRQPPDPLDVEQIARQVLVRHSRARAAGRTPSSNPSGGATARFLPGAMLASRYRIVALLGRGGMGEVYRADDLKLGQGVALKFLPASVGNDPAHLERLLNEVRLARQVSHPNVCRVYDVGETDGRHFISMEYVDGEDLSSLLKRIGRLPNEKALHIAQQLCAGLAAAHEQGILHRDLKPANVMLDGRGRVRIADFGLAAGAVVQGREAREGTKAYMAPEQLAGLEATKRSDLYALGLVLYEVFTGRKAFPADSEQELRRMQEESSPARPSSLVEGIDPAVERTILKCLERDPTLRPTSAPAVAAMMPGGDPLAAALAAGETPSPEMVAAAGESVGLRPPVAVACLTTALLGLAALVYIAPRVNPLYTVALDKHPEVLAANARAILRDLDFTEPPGDSAYSFSYSKADAREAYAGQAPRARRGIASVRPSPIYFWYRQSPRPLVPFGRGWWITLRDPPGIDSGVTAVVLDPQGRLIEFETIPPERDEDPGPWADPDWSKLLSHAGLEPADLRPVSPEWNSLAASDRRVAWEGVYPNQPEVPIRIEAGAYHGRAAWFRIVPPWGEAFRMGPALQSGEWRRAVVTLLLYSSLLVAGAFLARRNTRLGRGDRRGAFRLTAYVLAVDIIQAAIGGHHVATGDEIWLLVEETSWALFVAGAVWLCYLAIEPYARKLWPEMLIGWTRLLAGRLRDPVVGRDLLVGGLTGILLIVLIGSLECALYLWMGLPSPAAEGLPWSFGSLYWQASALSGLRVAAAIVLLLHLANGLIFPVMMLFVLLLSRFLLRRGWAAAALTVLVFAGMFAAISERPWFVLPFAVASMLAIVLVLLRFGLLAVMSAGTCINAILAVPVTFDLSAWYADRGMVGLAVVVGLLAWGFRAAVAGHTLLPVGRLAGEGGRS